jgi:hypothetical protein
MMQEPWVDQMTTDLTPFISEVAGLERTPRGVRPHRLPDAVRRRFPDPQLLAVESQPSGVRLAFASRATSVQLELHPTRLTYAGVERERGRVDLVVDGAVTDSSELTGGDAIETDLTTGSTRLDPGIAHTATFQLPPGEKTIELWLPHNESVELVTLRTNAAIHAVQDDRPLWMHHGSSISHGSNAVSPTGIWPAVAARGAGARLRNLGLGGSALLDPFLARMMRDSPADVLSLKIGINLVNLDAMRLRTFNAALHGFLDTIRDGHPDEPLLLITPIHCAIHENTPGPGSLDRAALSAGQVRFLATGTPSDTTLGRLTLQTVRNTITEVAHHRDDPRLTLIDGLTLYGAADEEAIPLPDGLHPAAAAHELIGQRFTHALRAALETR